jgi:dihydrolipoamide dehydrogenase
VAGIYAIGDVAGPPLLAHKAMHEGIVAVEHIAGLEPLPLDPSHIPNCTYCQPQVASVGLTETQAIEQGYQVKIGRFPFRGIGKALAIQEHEGFVKLVVDAQYDEILGAHIIGSQATEMIHEIVLAKTAELTPEELVSTVHAHPTLSESIHEAALDVEGQAIHMAKMKKKKT